MWQKNVRYLDYNAGSGLSPLVQQKLIDFMQAEFVFANPSSQHRLGQKVKHQLRLATEKVARSFHANADDILFTSSGTEANQTVIRSLLVDGVGVIIGSAEHSASYDLFSSLPHSFKKLLPLSDSGEYDLVALEKLLHEAAAQGLKSIFLSLAWANNETGILLRLEALTALLQKAPLSVVLHLDAAQVWGKHEIQVEKTPADFITFAAHKIGALAGVGVIWSKPASKHLLKPLFIGTQANGLRGGTENVLGILAAGFAAEQLNPKSFQVVTQPLQHALEEALRAMHSESFEVKIWGDRAPRVTNTSRISIQANLLGGGSADENWVELLDLHGFAVSHGSACKSQVREPSRVLLAMGASQSQALNSIRVSFGPQNTLADVHDFIHALSKIFELKRRAS